jgi:hypothetical protein
MISLFLNVLAQEYSDVSGDSPATLRDFEVVFSRIVEIVLGLAGVVLFLMLIMGGFRFITAGGDPKAIEGAKKTLTYAIGGIVLIALSFLILRFISTFTGVDVTQFKIFQGI